MQFFKLLGNSNEVYDPTSRSLEGEQCAHGAEHRLYGV